MTAASTTANSAGAFTFDNRFTRANSNSSTSASGADIADMLLGAPAAATGFIPTVLHEYITYKALYLQDDFRMSSKLTFNLGLRWERESGLQEAQNRLITSFNSTASNPIGTAANYPVKGVFGFAGVNGASGTTMSLKQNKWAPRFGVAYQLNDKTVIRGGWGMFWAPSFSLGSPYSSEGITATTQPSVSNDGNKTPALRFSNPFPNGLDRPVGSALGDLTGVGKAMTIFDPNATSTRVQQFSLDMQRQFAGGWVVTAGYSGSRTADLTWSTAAYNVNQLDPAYFPRGSALTAAVANPFFGKGGTGVIAGSTVAANQLLRPYPQFANINLTNSSRNQAQYDSLTLKAQKSLTKGLSVLSAYTFSKNFDMSGGGPGNNLNAGNSGPQDIYGLAGEWGLSYLHSPHRLVSAVTYELPVGKGKMLFGNMPKAADMVLGGWSVNTVSTYLTGFPLQIYMNNNGNSALGTSRQRPNATGVSPEVDGAVGSKIDGWINKAAFSDAAPFTLGNVTRTISMRGPGQANWDISVFKTVTVYERFKAQFRAESLNAFNTPYFRAPNTAFGNGAFGKITTQGNFPRLIQLGLRLYF